jgi:hypothetical protein
MFLPYALLPGEAGFPAGAPGAAHAALAPNRMHIPEI